MGAFLIDVGRSLVVVWAYYEMKLILVYEWLKGL